MSDRKNPGYHPTTTHAEWGAGNPRLTVRGDDDHRVFPLTLDVVKIGSDLASDLVLDGIDAHHATIVHDEHDEYVLTMHGPGEMNATHPDAGPDEEPFEVLRTGARFTAGRWEIVCAREEFADHGRPYGGRLGGELSDQPPQPVRPDYTGSGESSDGLEVTPG